MTLAVFAGSGTANARYCKAKVNDQKGVVIFPDGYSHPAGPAQPVDINNASVSLYDAANSWSVDSWAAMEAAGCVFLPAAGYRSYDFGKGSDVVYYFVVGNGGYWSCTAGGERFPQEAYMLDIADEVLDATAHCERNQGFPVRQVRDVTQN